MNNKHVEDFVMYVDKIFRLEDGTNVFIGEVLGKKKIITPCRAKVIFGDMSIANLQIEGERMPGPTLPTTYRVVYTRDPIEFDTSIGSGNYILISEQIDIV